MANIQVMCSNLQCRSILSVPVSSRGKTVRCGRCGVKVKVPEPKEVQASK